MELTCVQIKCHCFSFKGGKMRHTPPLNTSERVRKGLDQRCLQGWIWRSWENNRRVDTPAKLDKTQKPDRNTLLVWREQRSSVFSGQSALFNRNPTMSIHTVKHAGGSTMFEVPLDSVSPLINPLVFRLLPLGGRSSSKQSCSCVYIPFFRMDWTSRCKMKRFCGCWGIFLL